MTAMQVHIKMKRGSHIVNLVPWANMQRIIKVPLARNVMKGFIQMKLVPLCASNVTRGCIKIKRVQAFVKVVQWVPSMMTLVKLHANSVYKEHIAMSVVRSRVYHVKRVLSRMKEGKVIAKFANQATTVNQLDKKAALLVKQEHFPTQLVVSLVHHVTKEHIKTKLESHIAFPVQ